VKSLANRGRSYFHVVSANSTKYKPADADRQYNNCMKAKGARLATIATFYYYCKQAGLQTYSKQTKTIMSAGIHGKKGGLNVKSIANNLQKSLKRYPLKKVSRYWNRYLTVPLKMCRMKARLNS
jgi:hypothetical protein